jgi:hypothetical protein
MDEDATPLPTPLITPPTINIYFGFFEVFLAAGLAATLVDDFLRVAIIRED